MSRLHELVEAIENHRVPKALYDEVWHAAQYDMPECHDDDWLLARLIEARSYPHLSDDELVQPEFATEEVRDQQELEHTEMRVGAIMADDTLAAQLYKRLEVAHKVVGYFKDQHSREPSDAELRIMASLWIEDNKREAREARGQKRANGGGDAPSAGTPTQCPKCSGPIYDNREDKRAGSKSKKWPDFKCRDAECGWAAWGKNRDD